MKEVLLLIIPVAVLIKLILCATSRWSLVHGQPVNSFADGVHAFFAGHVFSRYTLYFFSFLICIFSFPLAARSQDNTPTRREQLLWFRYNLELPLNDKWQIGQEIEERAYVNPWRQGEFRLRSHLIRKLGKGWAADVGFMFVWEKEPIEPYREDTNLRLEIRPHQQISYQHKLGEHFSFQHTYKVEERFFEQKNSGGFYNDSGIAYERMRFRYELELGYQVNDWLGLELFNEVVFHVGPKVGPNPFDRYESGGGAAFKLSDAFGLDITYNYRYNPEGMGEMVVHQHIGRFTLNHTINRK